MEVLVRSASFSLCASVVIAMSASAQATPKLAYINSQVILRQAPGRAEAEQQFEREMTTYRSQVKLMGDSLNTLIADYNRLEVTLSPAAKETKQKAIRGKEEEYQQRARQLEQQVQSREQELVRPIMEQIQKVIDAIRAEEGYTMIFDAGSQAGVLVAADKNLEITEKVLARLRTMPPVASKPAAKPAGTPAGTPTATPSGVTRPKNPPR